MAEHMTLPRLRALMRAWETMPSAPAALGIIARALGWKPPASSTRKRGAKRPSRDEILAELGAIPGVVVER